MYLLRDRILKLSLRPISFLFWAKMLWQTPQGGVCNAQGEGWMAEWKIIVCVISDISQEETLPNLD